MTERFAYNCIIKDLEELKRDPPMLGCTVEPIGDDNIFNYNATIIGPPDTPYEDGVFLLLIRFPCDYPHTPVKLKFKTRIYHPNITNDGMINLSDLFNITPLQQWTPAMTISKVLLLVCSLLREPEILDYAITEIGQIYMMDRESYIKIAREWTLKYAML